MPVNPYVYIDPPEVVPYKHGLFGSVQTLTPDEHWLIGGAEWESLANFPSELYPAGIFQVGGAGGTKTLPAGVATSKAWPFAVYAGIACGTIGYTPEEFVARANRVLELSSQHAAERALWTGAAGNAPALNVTGTTVVTGAASRLDVALGLLENWLADNYAGQGQIHGRRSVSTAAARHRQVKCDPDNADQLVTQVGSRWIFGGGYDGTGPAAAAPSSGQTYIYATGQTFIARGAAEMPANFEESIKRTTNQEFLIAEQPYLIGVDGNTWAAALVDLTL